MNNNSTKTILIAEDEDGNYFLLEHYLSELNCKVLRAENGLEAVNICKSRNDIDLIFMDMRMPCMSGIDASIEIRKFNKQIIIIIVSAFNYNNEEKQEFQTYCNKIATKPISTKDIAVLFDYFF